MWLLTPEFDFGATTTSYQAEFDFGVYGYNTITPATCGSDDRFEFALSEDGGATWVTPFTADNTYVTSAGGGRVIIPLGPANTVTQFAFLQLMVLSLTLKMLISQLQTLLFSLLCHVRTIFSKCGCCYK